MALPFKKRVLIVEDDQEIRNSFSLIVNSSQKFMVINAYSNCEDAIDNINRDKPEIILMDIELPGMNGIQGTRIIKEKYPLIKVIALTMFNDERLVLDMMEAGADGYILKSTTKEELSEAIQAVYNGGTYFCNSSSLRMKK